MPGVDMNVQNRIGGVPGPTFQKTQELSAGEIGDWIYIPKGTNRITAIFSTLSGSGRLEVTNDSQENIEADTVDPESISISPDGTMTGDKVSRLLWSGNAIRSVNISGVTKAFFFAN